MHTFQETRLWPRISKILTPHFSFLSQQWAQQMQASYASQVLHHRDKSYGYDYTFANLASHINRSLFPQHRRSWSRISSIQASFHLLPICNDFTSHAHTHAPQTSYWQVSQRQKEKKNDIRKLTSLEREKIKMVGKGFLSCVVMYIFGLILVWAWLFTGK